jgi:hypothetical protein
MRIIGDDGKPELLTVNQRDATGRVLNDMTVGQYDVVMDTGPGYNSKRQEAVDSMLPLLAADPNLMNTAGDLVFRNMDWPGADVIADRLAALNPLAQIDEHSEIPPVVQMKLKQADEQVKQLTQKMQMMEMAMKQRQDIEQVRQDAETKRAIIKETNRAHEIELRDQERHADMKMKVDGQAHDTVLKTQTQLEIEQMKAQVALLLAQIDKTALRNASAETTERAI